MARGSSEAGACGGRGCVGSLPPKRSAAEAQRLCAPTRSIPESSDAESSGRKVQQNSASCSRGPSYCLIFTALSRKEQEKNQFQASIEALKDVNLDSVDGTDVQGWNRAPHHSIEWSQLNMYIIRAYGDCQTEVNMLYTSVLPKIRQVMLSCAVNVQLRDLGCISRPLPAERTDENKAPIGISLNSIRERNSICLVLVGFDYGDSWKRTAGDETLKSLGIDDDDVLFPQELSEFEILAMRAAQESEVKHTVFTGKMSAARTFVYTCVDPDSPFRSHGGLSPTR